MDSKDNRRRETERLLKSFSHAASGIFYVLIHERNMQYHCVFALLSILLGWVLGITTFEWMVILILIGGMFSLEIMNTAVEKTVDLVTQDFHPLAKLAKDIAAGAVFIFAIICMVIGILIFLPRLIEKF
jgi:undecaprenol kinase